MEFLKRDFPIIIDDRSVGLIRLFPMIDYEILADSQHYLPMTKLLLICTLMYIVGSLKFKCTYQVSKVNMKSTCDR